MKSEARIRIGAVNYLNTRPLVYGLEQLAPQADIIYDLPSRLADGLSAGRFDVALVPSIELLSNPDYEVVSDACIGCRGPVLSVKLFMRVPPEEIRSLALDEGSRTSIVLVQILLDRLVGARPALEPLPIGSDFDDSAADALLVIGDRAMHSPSGRFHTVWDLGDQWYRWTGLPFVFAMWASHGKCDLGDVPNALARSRDAGVAHLREIARRESGLLGLTEPQCYNYLSDNLNYCFGAGEQRGMELFFDYAAELEVEQGPVRARAAAADGEA